MDELKLSQIVERKAFSLLLMIDAGLSNYLIDECQYHDESFIEIICKRYNYNTNDYKSYYSTLLLDEGHIEYIKSDWNMK